jgi:hypothetical protein
METNQDDVSARAMARSARDLLRGTWPATTGAIIRVDGGVTRKV